MKILPEHKYNTNLRYNSFAPCRSLSQNADSVHFSGHFGVEKYAKNGIGCLIHETGFFRDMQTKDFVKNYILKNFADRNPVKILVGGCSTGEEALTYSMLLNDIGKQIKILGFDISEESIKNANSKKFLMQKIDKAPKGFMDISFQYKRTLQDEFLAFPAEKALSGEKLSRKKLFDEFFYISDEVPVLPKEKLGERINNWFIRKCLKIHIPTFENKYAVLKDGKEENCKFVTGDILELDEITKGEKYDVITFTNALYHVISDMVGNNLYRVLNKNAESTLEKLSVQLRKNLNEKGIFVLGEEEALQTFDNGLVARVLERNGFKSLNSTAEHAGNIWQG